MLASEVSGACCSMAQRKVEIGEYDPKWAVLYREEKAKIVAAIGHLAVAVEHIGSTAVVGLGAKPIIDIMVGVNGLSDVQECMEPLGSIGYEYQPEHEVTLPERLFSGRVNRLGSSIVICIWLRKVASFGRGI